MSAQVNARAREIDAAMVRLRESMTGIQIRTAGFKQLHDELARRVATLTVNVMDSKPLFPQK